MVQNAQSSANMHAVSSEVVLFHDASSFLLCMKHDASMLSRHVRDSDLWFIHCVIDVLCASEAFEILGRHELVGIEPINVGLVRIND